MSGSSEGRPRQLQALVRRLVTDRGLGTEGVHCLRLVEQAPEGVPLRQECGKLRRTRQTGLRPPDELCSETREMQPSVLSKVISYRGSEQLPNGALVVPLESVQARETRVVGEANIMPPECLLETTPQPVPGGNDSSCALAHNTPVPLKRSPPASFKRLLGSSGLKPASTKQRCPVGAVAVT